MSRITSSNPSNVSQSRMESTTVQNANPISSTTAVVGLQQGQDHNTFVTGEQAGGAEAPGGNSAPASQGMRSHLLNLQMAQASAPPDVNQLRETMLQFEQGRNVDAKSLKTIQAAALDTVLRTFDNRYGSDTALLQTVRDKSPHYQDFKLPQRDADALMGQDVPSRQRQALRILLSSFQSNSDDPIRLASIGKLAEMGQSQEDLRALITAAGKGNAAVLYASTCGVSQMCQRTGNPETRRLLAEDPVVGPQLQRTDLSTSERETLIEKVLQEGSIKKINYRPGQNRNQVFIVEFEDKVGGQPVRGIFKPEATWFGKDRAYFSREVAAYVFDRDFAKTGLVPMTTSTVLEFEGQHKLGSLQYMIPEMRPLGKDVLNYDPHFDGFRQTEQYQEQINKLRSLLYILADPDKLPNDVHSTANLQNILVDKNNRLWMIDNSYAMGAAPEISDQMLPDRVGHQMLQRLRDSDPQHIVDIMDDIIANRDAGDMVRRLEHALQKLQPDATP